MDKELFKELINSIEKDTIYDYIINNGYKFEKEDLSRIIAEAVYGSYFQGKTTYNEFLNNLKTNLIDFYEEQD